MEWPAPPTDRFGEREAAIERGVTFHQLVLQESLGMAVEEVVANSEDALLKEWWQNWRTLGPEVPAHETHSETINSVPVAGQRLVARFDRVMVESGRVWVFDWKTGRKMPEQSEYADSWQTLVYRFVMAEAGALWNGGQPIAPADITLIYWHAQYPETLRPIGYCNAEHEEARRLISAAITSIVALPDENAFAKTDDLNECRRCEFQAYCDRISAPPEDWDIGEDELDWDITPEP